MPGKYDLAPLLELNNLHAEELSFLTPERFEVLISRAFFARHIGRDSGFILTFDQSADYDSENFIWFRERYERFIYVDRVVIAESARGRGFARLLYEELFVTAKLAGHDKIVCEVNSEPPNPASDAFHEALGFVEVGGAHLQAKEKSVRYFMKQL